MAIDALWALRFGNGTTATRHTLMFTAGIGGEAPGRRAASPPPLVLAHDLARR